MAPGARARDHPGEPRAPLTASRRRHGCSMYSCTTEIALERPPRVATPRWPQDASQTPAALSGVPGAPYAAQMGTAYSVCTCYTSYNRDAPHREYREEISYVRSRRTG